MFARISSFAIFALPLLAAATAIPRDGAPTTSCSTGSVNCCNSVQNSTSTSVSQLAGLLGIDLSSITAQIGLACSPLLLGSTNCANQVACCSGNTFNGLITLGCNPLNIGL